MGRNYMKKKLTNEEKYKYTKYRILCWYLVIITGIMTIAFSLLSLIQHVSPIFAVISFILEMVFTKLMKYFKEVKKEKE